MFKVLLVDDEPLVRRGIRSMLPLADYQMEWAGEASSAEEARAILSVQSVDLVMTDISMPGQDGLAFIRSLTETYPSILSVVITCHQDFSYVQQALRLGAVDYMVKTQLDDQTVHELLERVSRQLLQKTERERPAGTEPGDDAYSFRRLLDKWSSLGWIAETDLWQELLEETVHALSAPAWKGLLTEAVGQWPVRCPSLLPVTEELLPRLGAVHTLPELNGWTDTFRQEAMRRFCATMYSEQVIASILRALDLLHNASGERWTQTELCRAVNLSVSYFSKCFKEIVGVSFVYHVQEANLREAQRLLQTTNLPVYEVAEKSGFTDEKYFGKIFRAKTGHSPSEYRSASRNK
ncbi:response regulator transcription factor [Gorillibacterium massiliense]|uniref:response regulator transcription factor n=1 Tax=Gorillibacterium massiliense TaxID=1280390 RepID=UPI0004B2A4A8|nr:response regulator [Gorillibacterium massiliense]